MSKEHDNSLLMNAIQAAAARRGMNLSALAEHLGISRAYLYALRGGQRSTANLSRETVLDMAELLNTTPAAVFVMAGIIRPEDYYQESPETLRCTIERAFDFVATDPEWNEFCPAPATLPVSAKLYVVLCYQRANGRQLLPQNADRTALMDAITATK